MRTSSWTRFHNLELQRNGAAFHCYAPLLFVFPAVEVTHLTRHSRRDYVVCCEESIHKRRLSMVDVAQSCYDSDVCSIGGLHPA